MGDIYLTVDRVSSRGVEHEIFYHNLTSIPADQSLLFRTFYVRIDKNNSFLDSMGSLRRLCARIIRVFRGFSSQRHHQPEEDNVTPKSFGPSRGCRRPKAKPHAPGWDFRAHPTDNGFELRSGDDIRAYIDNDGVSSCSSRDSVVRPKWHFRHLLSPLYSIVPNRFPPLTSTRVPGWALPLGFPREASDSKSAQPHGYLRRTPVKATRSIIQDTSIGIRFTN